MRRHTILNSVQNEHVHNNSLAWKIKRSRQITGLTYTDSSQTTYLISMAATAGTMTIFSRPQKQKDWLKLSRTKMEELLRTKSALANFNIETKKGLQSYHPDQRTILAVYQYLLPSGRRIPSLGPQAEFQPWFEWSSGLDPRDAPSSLHPQ